MKHSSAPLAPYPAADRLAKLRAAIRSIERKPAPVVPLEISPPGSPFPALHAGSGPGQKADAAKPREQERGNWTLGDPGLDALLGGGLETGAVHEIKPEGGGDWTSAHTAARRFALGLALRRLRTCPQDQDTAPVLWCTSARQACEAGRAYGPGLAALGLDPARLILVEPAREADVVWVIEEGLKSQALALVLGEAGDVGLTPARRLALAAAASTTPCLLLTSARSASVASTATRWRIAPASSAPHPFDPQAPGAPRCNAVLERCRGRPAAVQSVSLVLEWSDAAFHLSVAAGLADRPAPAHLAPGKSSHPLALA